MTITDENGRTQSVEIRRGQRAELRGPHQDHLAAGGGPPRGDRGAVPEARRTPRARRRPYDGPVKRDKAYNATIDEHNAILDADCAVE